MIWPVCCRRDAAEPPNAKIRAATMAPPGCQPRSRKYMMTREASGKQIGEGDEIGFAKARRRRECRESEMQRREDQRLRIGDLRPAGIEVRAPERRLAVRERGREKLQLRLELRFRVPRNGDGAGEPRPRQSDEAENRGRAGPRRLTSSATAAASRPSAVRHRVSRAGCPRRAPSPPISEFRRRSSRRNSPACRNWARRRAAQGCRPPPWSGSFR